MLSVVVVKILCEGKWVTLTVCLVLVLVYNQPLTEWGIHLFYISCYSVYNQ